MLYTKITRDNIEQFFDLLTIYNLVTEEQINERFFHIGKYIYVDKQNKRVFISRDQPEGSQVFFQQFRNSFRMMYKSIKKTEIEYKTHNLLNKEYRYHLYQCRDGLNIWTKQRIDPGEHVQIGKLVYKLYPSQERINSPQQSINSDELYYEFTIKEVK